MDVMLLLIIATIIGVVVIGLLVFIDRTRSFRHGKNKIASSKPHQNFLKFSASPLKKPKPHSKTLAELQEELTANNLARQGDTEPTNSPILISTPIPIAHSTKQAIDKPAFEELTSTDFVFEEIAVASPASKSQKQPNPTTTEIALPFHLDEFGFDLLNDTIASITPEALENSHLNGLDTLIAQPIYPTQSTISMPLHAVATTDTEILSDVKDTESLDFEMLLDSDVIFERDSNTSTTNAIDHEPLQYWAESPQIELLNDFGWLNKIDRTQQNLELAQLYIELNDYTSAKHLLGEIHQPTPTQKERQSYLLALIDHIKAE